MARWIVLSNARIAGDGVAVRLYRAGDVLDDAHVDVASLRRNGLAVAPYSEAMERSLRAFRSAQRANPHLDMLGAILGDDAASAALRVPSGVDPVTIWVDAELGDDAADGSEARPLRTLRAAVERVPVPNSRDYRIRLAAGTYNADVLTERGFLCIGGSVEFLPAGSPTVLAEAVATGVPADPGVVVAGAGWTVDEFAGKTARVLVDSWGDGVPRYVYKTIARNTADTLLFAASIFDDATFSNVTPGAGDEIQIIEPAINFELTGRAGEGNGCIVGDLAAKRWGHGSVTLPSFVDTVRAFFIRWIASAPYGLAATIAGELVHYGCEVDRQGAIGSQCEVAVRAAGAWDAFGPGRRFGELEVFPGDGLIERTGQLCGCGVLIDDEFGPRDFRGFVVAQNVEGYGGLVHLMGGRILANDAGAPWQPGITNTRPTTLRLGMFSGTFSPLGYLYLIPTTGREFNDAAIYLSSPGALEAYRGGAVIIDTGGVAGVDGIRVQGATVGGIASGLAFRIAVHSGANGVHARRGARLTVLPSATTITGATNAYRAGNVTGATVTSSAPLIASSPADGSALLVN